MIVIVIIFCEGLLASCVKREEVSVFGLFLCCGVSMAECSAGVLGWFLLFSELFPEELNRVTVFVMGLAV